MRSLGTQQEHPHYFALLADEKRALHLFRGSETVVRSEIDECSKNVFHLAD